MPKIDLSIKIKKYFVDKMLINSIKCKFLMFLKEKDYIFLIFLLIFRIKDMFEKQCFTKIDSFTNKYSDKNLQNKKSLKLNIV
jgi:hypothetical protein